MMREMNDYSGAASHVLFKVAFGASVVVALLSWEWPQRQMPVNYNFIRLWSTPMAVLWASIVILSAIRIRKRALWMLLGAPLVLYWPIWFAIHGLPNCYWNATCK